MSDKLWLTFGGMWRWRRVAVARVFALVVRCRIMRLLVYSRVGKNRDTRRESPAGAGAARTADHLAILFSQKVLAVRRANDIYRPVMCRLYLLIIILVFFRMAFCFASLSSIQSCIESWQDLHTDTNQSIGSRPMLYFAYFLWWTSVA